MTTKKKTSEELRENKLLNRACREVVGFSEQNLQKIILFLYKNLPEKQKAALKLLFILCPFQTTSPQLQIKSVQRRPVKFNIGFIACPAGTTKP